MSNKDEFVSSLFQPKSKPPSAGGPLIQDVNADGTSAAAAAAPAPAAPPAEEKTMMELMMEAQQAARKEKEVAKEKERVKESKQVGGGFKKGFFGGGGGSAKPKTATAAAAKSAPTSVFSGATAKATATTTKTSSASSSSGSSGGDGIVNLSKPKPNANNIASGGAAGGAAGGKNSSLVMDEVQHAMRAEEEAMLGQLKTGEWMTDDLMSKFQANPTIRSGLMHPKCSAAMQMMQSNPEEAKRRFAGDPEVDAFMREFGKVMSEHFNALGEKQAKEQKQQAAQGQAAGKKVAVVEEIGPLQRQATERQKQQQQQQAKQQASAGGGGTSAEDKRVAEILKNDELKALLMDVEMQRILQECGDPVKFQQHMRDPVVSRKIKLLWDNGLVGTAK